MSKSAKNIHSKLIGWKVKAFITANDITIAYASKQTGLCRSYIYNVLRNSAPLTIKSIHMLEKGLGIKLIDFNVDIEYILIVLALLRMKIDKN